MLNDGIATFTPGSQEATVEIRALTDAIQEPDEMFTIEARLTESSNALGVVIGGDGRANVTVKDMTAGNNIYVTVHGGCQSCCCMHDSFTNSPPAPAMSVPLLQL